MLLTDHSCSCQDMKDCVGRGSCIVCSAVDPSGPVGCKRDCVERGRIALSEAGLRRTRQNCLVADLEIVGVPVVASDSRGSVDNFLPFAPLRPKSSHGARDGLVDGEKRQPKQGLIFSARVEATGQ